MQTRRHRINLVTTLTPVHYHFFLMSMGNCTIIEFKWKRLFKFPTLRIKTLQTTCIHMSFSLLTIYSVYNNFMFCVNEVQKIKKYLALITIFIFKSYFVQIVANVTVKRSVLVSSQATVFPKVALVYILGHFTS